MDDFTPFGYLDNPWHCACANPSGVVRSLPGVGFAWHWPARAGGYVRHERYRAGLRLAFGHGEGFLLETTDFARAGVGLVSRTHSKNIMSYEWRVAALVCRAAFFLAGEHALCCLLTIASERDEPLEARWAFVAEYERRIGAGDDWDLGLVGTMTTSAPLTLVAYPEGEAFACASDRPSQMVHFAVSRENLRRALANGHSQYGVAAGPNGGAASVFGALGCQVTITPDMPYEQLVVLGRGITGERAAQAAAAALADGRSRFAGHEHADAVFSRGRPALDGEWPASWRRGVIYDAETLRMIARHPIGKFRYPWDGMQIQSPRRVLAETSLDALLVSYSDPALAQSVLLGVFADAPAANIPCTREDGSYNMVAEDGVPCGTAPEWCFPLYCADLLFRRTGDRHWLAKLYPHLSRYLSWWLRHRTDDAGWLHYHCSWESGQDDSPRFGPQASGGSLIAHIRPVDLQAAVAQGAEILERFALLLGRQRGARHWARVAKQYAAMTQQLWNRDWFHDWDCRACEPVSLRDPMHLTPLLAGIATSAQKENLRTTFAHLPPHGVWPPLYWPPVVFTVVEAACAAGWHDIAGAIAFDVAERVYRAYDNRSPSADDPLPGIASEFWPARGTWGCEGYGWGALGTLLVLRHVVGWQEETSGAVSLHPQLPAGWLVPGRRFAVAPMHHYGLRIGLEYECLDEKGDLAIAIRWTGNPTALAVSGRVYVRASNAPDGENVITWRGRNGEAFLLKSET